MKITALALVLLVGCNAEEEVEDNYPPDLPLADEYRTCEVDNDCVIGQLGVCDHCNGGLAVAVSVDREQDAIDAFSESEPSGEWGCTEMGCPAVDAICEESLCVEVDLGL